MYDLKKIFHGVYDFLSADGGYTSFRGIPQNSAKF